MSSGEARRKAVKAVSCQHRVSTGGGRDHLAAVRRPAGLGGRGTGRRAADRDQDRLLLAQPRGVLFFSVITRQAIRRGTFRSVSQLISAIGAFIDHWNDHPRPFTWTKDADEIPASIQRAKTKTNSFTRH